MSYEGLKMRDNKGYNHKKDCKCTFCSGESWFKKGHKSGMYGKKHTKKTKQIIRETKMGEKNPMFNKIFSKEHRKKLVENNPHYWKDKKRSETTKQKISDKLVGRKLSVKHKENIKKNNCKYWKGKKRDERTRQILIEWRKKNVFPIKDTKIEIKIQNFLKQLQIPFFTHQYMKIEHGYQCDFFIPSMNLVIEADGDYWHKYPTGREIDHIRTSELLSKGFKILRLWECEINNMSIKQFRRKLESGI